MVKIFAVPNINFITLFQITTTFFYVFLLARKSRHGGTYPSEYVSFFLTVACQSSIVPPFLFAAPTFPLLHSDKTKNSYMD